VVGPDHAQCSGRTGLAVEVGLSLWWGLTMPSVVAGRDWPRLSGGIRHGFHRTLKGWRLVLKKTCSTGQKDAWTNALKRPTSYPILHIHFSCAQSVTCDQTGSCRTLFTTLQSNDNHHSCQSIQTGSVVVDEKQYRHMTSTPDGDCTAIQDGRCDKDIIVRLYDWERETITANSASRHFCQFN